MINFKKLEGPNGIPIYFQKLPEIVQSVALEWVIFTGSADDDNVNAHGAHHWFEHVPFRGTKRFPDGYASIMGPFTRMGGDINAYTTPSVTAYHAHVQLEQWKQALDVITDLWAQPLLTDEGINAERTIIIEEIRRSLSTAQGNAFYNLINNIWPNHPLGHHTLGTEESLKSITPEQLRQAHKLGYDRSRVTLFVSGNLSEQEILDYVNELAKIMPDNGLSERRAVAFHQPVPQIELGTETVISTHFPSSIVYMLFPVKAKRPIEKLIFDSFLLDMVSEGGLDSPLYRIVREERQLAYNVKATHYSHPDGGWIGFVVETKTANIEKAKQAFIDVLKDPEIRSEERFKKVKDAIYSEEKMRSISSQLFNDIAVSKLTYLGKVMSDEEYNSYIEKITLDDVQKAFDSMTKDKSHTFIFKGEGN